MSRCLFALLLLAGASAPVLAQQPDTHPRGPVLRDQPAWTSEKIEAAMKGDRPTRVNLRQPLTVVLFYDTVHVNSEGVVFFVEDIYGHDRALDAALGRGYPYPVKG